MGQRIAIVGSRRRTDAATVDAIVAALPPDAIVVSGGAKGPDSWAKAAALRRGLGFREFLPEMDGATTYVDRTKRYYARNQAIVDHADAVVALVSPDRKGGTEDTVRRAERKGIPVTLA